MIQGFGDLAAVAGHCSMRTLRARGCGCRSGTRSVLRRRWGCSPCRPCSASPHRAGLLAAASAAARRSVGHAVLPAFWIASASGCWVASAILAATSMFLISRSYCPRRASMSTFCVRRGPLELPLHGRYAPCSQLETGRTSLRRRLCRLRHRIRRRHATIRYRRQRASPGGPARAPGSTSAPDGSSVNTAAAPVIARVSPEPCRSTETLSFESPARPASTAGCRGRRTTPGGSAS